MERRDMKWIVVTGAAGMIGSGVVRYLNNLGETRLILVDDLKQGEKWRNLLGKRSADWVSKEQLFTWVKGRESEIEAWVHMGACSNTLETDGDYLMENNFRYTQRIAEIALQHGHRFIYASSAATYGDGRRGFSDDHEKLSSLEPLNLYGFSKHFFDLWAQERGILDQIVGLKYFNVFGPNEQHKGAMASMVFKMTPWIQQRGSIELFHSSDPERFGDGEQCRDFVYVKDAVRLTCSFLNNTICGIFNLGRGEPATWNRLARALFAALHLPVRIAYIPMPASMVAQYQNYTCADMSKWQARLPLHWEYTLEEAVADYVQCHLLKGAVW